MEQNELEKEWISKFDIGTGRLKENLSSQCYEWAKTNHKITDELIQQQLKEELIKCYEDIISFLGEWMDMPENYKKYIAIVIIGTYFHHQFDTFPYTLINATKGAAKTRLLRIISYLVKNGNGNLLNNPSEPVLFRTAKERALIIDEFESEKSKDKQTLREYLNSCYKRGGVVYRMERVKIEGQEKMVAAPHFLYTPVFMANINGLDEVLGDRSIVITLEKSDSPLYTKKIEDFQRNPKIAQISSKLRLISVELCNVHPLQKGIDDWNSYVNERYTTTLHTLHTIHTIHNYTQLNTTLQLEEIFKKIDNSGIFGRNFELLFPLLLIAQMLGEEIFNDFLEIAISLNTIKREEESTESRDAVLMEFVSTKEQYQFEYVFMSKLFTEFKIFLGISGDDEERMWLNMTWFGLALKRLKLVSLTKRVPSGKMVILNVNKAKEKLKIFKEVEK